MKEGFSARSRGNLFCLKCPTQTAFSYPSLTFLYLCPHNRNVGKDALFLFIALIHRRCCSIKASNKVYFHFYLERWPPLKLKANSKEMGISIES